jgi:hypothetical protein
LGVCLDAAERHGERYAGAQQTAISHPLPPAANTRVTMVVAPPFAYLHHPSRGWQSLFALTPPVGDKSMQNVADRDIPATVLRKRGKFRLSRCVFSATISGLSLACGGTASNSELHLA